MGDRPWQLLDLTAALAGFGYFLWAAEHPWRFATILGFSVGVLAFISRRTVTNLYRLYRSGPAVVLESDPVDPGSTDPSSTGGSSGDGDDPPRHGNTPRATNKST
ncbi:MAG: hypothetical protein AAGN66_09305 [Acidobacteriota bacterium]